MSVVEGTAVALVCIFTVFAALGGLYALIKAISLLLRALERKTGKEA